jgi:metallo-beta-lactamase class B
MHKTFGGLAAALALACGSAGAQSTTPSTPSFPNELWADVATHLNAARLIAGNENRQHFNRACIYAQVYPMYAASAQAPYLMPPIQVFDNMYWVGQGAVSAWVLKTSAGLVVIDTLSSQSQVSSILLAGMAQLGLNPADIKYVLLTNEKADHVGGAAYLQQTYGAQVMASAAAWTAMATMAGAPAQNLVLADGQRVTIGDTMLEITLTPGVTAGALTATLPVFDHGTRRVAAFHSGLGIPDSAADKLTYLDSIARFSNVSQAAGVNTLLASYQAEDLSLYGQDLLRHRRAYSRSAGRTSADFQDPHPYVMSTDGYQRFLQIMSECTRVAAARNGQVLVPSRAASRR